MKTISNEQRSKEHIKNFNALKRKMKKDKKFLKKNEDKYALMYKKEIIGIYEDPFKAFDEGNKKYTKNEIFSIQEITLEIKHFLMSQQLIEPIGQLAKV